MESFCNHGIPKQTRSECNLKCKPVFRLPNIEDISILVSAILAGRLSLLYLVYAVQARVLD